MVTMNGMIKKNKTVSQRHKIVLREIPFICFKNILSETLPERIHFRIPKNAGAIINLG